MHVVIPHVGKSHLTYRLCTSIPDKHKIVLVDGSYVQDMGVFAFNRQNQIDYVQTRGVPHCLAKNWNIGAARVPESEPYWLFCATDVEFHPGSWNQIDIEERLYPDCGIIKDRVLNWNVWLIRRWAWDLLKPMDERYIPCTGEDDDLNMKCAASNIKIRAGSFRVTTNEGGHGSRLDIHRPGINSDKDIRPRVVGHFQRKWGIAPSSRHDVRYTEAKQKVYIGGRRRKEPPEEFHIPTERGDYGKLPEVWPVPLHLHLGCGRQKKRGFLNVDVCEAVKPDYLCDVVAEPWPWNEVSSIESYHMIEHLTQAEGKTLVEKAFAALKQGGKLVLECPDIKAACARYMKGGDWKLKHIFGNQTTPWQQHKWGYTQDSLGRLLESVGFKVTHKGEGTDYHTKSEPCIRVEAIKP